MSRIGLKPITVPAGVEVTIAEGNHVTVKGPKGTLEKQFDTALTITKEGDVITVTFYLFFTSFTFFTSYIFTSVFYTFTFVWFWFSPISYFSSVVTN